MRILLGSIGDFNLSQKEIWEIKIFKLNLNCHTFMQLASDSTPREYTLPLKCRHSLRQALFPPKALDTGR